MSSTKMTRNNTLYTLIGRIPNCIELDHYNLWGSLSLQPDDEKKANLILSALRAEAKAELFYKKINCIYCPSSLSLSLSLSRIQHDLLEREQRSE
jgi:hypothetical protein